MKEFNESYKLVAIYGSAVNKNKIYEIVGDKVYGENSNYCCRISELDLDKHEIHTIERTCDKKLISIGDITLSGKIARIIPTEDTVWFYHGVHSGPNLHLLDIPLKNNFIDLSGKSNIEFINKKLLLLL